jgi:hypothetical protein
MLSLAEWGAVAVCRAVEAAVLWEEEIFKVPAVMSQLVPGAK